MRISKLRTRLAWFEGIQHMFLPTEQPFLLELRYLVGKYLPRSRRNLEVFQIDCQGTRKRPYSSLTRIVKTQPRVPLDPPTEAARMIEPRS
jgi:hypothetical protein